jgi:hypothetical protein
MENCFRSAKAVEGSPIKLEGKMSGHPMPNVKWLLNEQVSKDGLLKRGVDSLENSNRE